MKTLLVALVLGGAIWIATPPAPAQCQGYCAGRCETARDCAHDCYCLGGGGDYGRCVGGDY